MRYFDRLKTWPQARRLLADGLPNDTVVALDEAAAFAISCHGDQMRPSVEPVPYVERVVPLVRWVTKGDDRAAYLDSLRDAPPDALLVKLADRVSNVQHLESFARRAKRGRYYRETIEHILPLAARHPWFHGWFTAWQEEKKGLAALS